MHRHPSALRRRLRGRVSAALLGACLGVVAPAWGDGVGGVAAQLPVASPSFRGTAASSAASLRGAGGLAANPAALALPTSPRWSLVLPSGSLLTALDPVTGRDLGRWGGKRVPEAERERWLQRITSAGGERGAAGGEGTVLALSRGRWGIQLGSMATGSTRLSPDAAELLLFGNAGRSGTPGDFQLAGSRLDLGVYTSVALTRAIPLRLPGSWGIPGATALGASLKLTGGTFLLLGRDAGSVLRGEPNRLELRFPLVESAPGGGPASGGWGMGLDLGAAWESGPWAGSLRLENLFHTFGWDPERLRYRPGEALFQGGETDSDFDPVPLREGPPGFRELVDELRFRPALEVGAARSIGRLTRVSASWREAAGGGISTGARRRVAMGVEHEARPWLPLGIGIAVDPGGWWGTAGVGLVRGGAGLHLTGGLRRGDDGPATRLGVGIRMTGGS